MRIGSLKLRIAGAMAMVVMGAAMADDPFLPASLGKPATWAARPDWIAPTATDISAKTTDEGLTFSIKGKGKGMKWLASSETAGDAELMPWFVLKYRCRGCDTNIEYLVWMGQAGKPDGMVVVKGADMKADGAWHTVAVDLTTLGVATVQSVAVTVLAAEEEADLTVAEMRLADTPPAEAENVAGGPPKMVRAVDLGNYLSWIAQPDWLASPAASTKVEKTADGLKFSVSGASKGMKFSHIVTDEPVPPGYFKLRYRCEGVASINDYALYAANAPGGRAGDEQYVFYLEQLVADGQWHVLMGQGKVAGATTLATQVQVAPGMESAWLEIGALEVWSGRPTPKMSDEATFTSGWAQNLARWKPMTPPSGISATQASRMLGVDGWFPDEKITVSGVPFQVSLSGAAGSGAVEMGKVTAAAKGKWRQVYLLMGARTPSSAGPGYQGSGRVITLPHHFVCELSYAGSSVEQQMPTRMATGTPEVAPGVAAYALAVDPGRELESVTLVDGHPRAAFVLLAVTATEADGPATLASKPVAAPVVVARPRKSAAHRVEVRTGEIVVEAGALHAKISTAQGLQLTALTSDYISEKVATAAWAGRLVSIGVGQITVGSDEAKVTGVEKAGTDGAVVSLDFAPTLPVQAKLTLTARAEDEIALGLEITAKTETEPVVTLPTLSGAKVTDEPAGTWVFYPGRGSAFTKGAYSASAIYGGMFPLQVMGIYAPGGGGLYVRTEYTEVVDRNYEVAKTKDGVNLGVRYPWWRGEKLNAVIGTNAGDWHGQLAAYERWRQTALQPAAPRKDWFRRIFNFRQQFMSFPVPHDSGMFDPKTKRFNFEAAVETDRKAFGGIDYLHLFDWGYDPTHGRCGDYTPWEYLGGVDNFRQAVGGVQKSGVPVGLYIEGYLVSPPSSIFAKAQAWQVLQPDGKPITPFAPDVSMCPWVTEWQDWLSGRYGQAKHDTGADGYYIDEYGFAGSACYATTHGHKAPIYTAGGELEMVRKVRAALGPDRAIYTEETPCDITQQWQDGSFTYAISSADDLLSPSHVNINRFAAPDFKTIEIITCDYPLGDNIEACRRILFNGEAIWLEGIAADWFAPRTLEYIRHMHEVLRAEADCFTGPTPEALVATKWQGMYANRFARADGKRCVWTVYWTGARTLKGAWLTVPHVDGAKYHEAWSGKALTVERAGANDVIGGSIDPHEVLVVVQETP